MRAVFIGASTLTVTTARLAIEKGHEVVIVEVNQERIDELSEELDCGFIHGDGSFPSILEEVSPENTDFLFCLTDNDQDNIIASLVGQEMEFDRVITRIENCDFDKICKQLKLEEVFHPDQQVAHSLVDIIEGNKRARKLTELQGDLLFFKFQVMEDTPKNVKGLDLPEDTRMVCISRGKDAYLPTEQETLQEGDIVTLITRDQQIDTLSSKFKLPHPSESKKEGE